MLAQILSLEDTFMSASKGDKAEQNNLSEVSVSQINEDVTHSDDSLGVKGESIDTDFEIVHEDSTPLTLENQIDVCSLTDLFKVSREELITEQDTDPSLKPLSAVALSTEIPEESKVCCAVSGCPTGILLLTLWCRLLYQLNLEELCWSWLIMV